MSSRHAQPPRGLVRQGAAPKPSWNHQSCFGRLFPDYETPGVFTENALEKLAKAMVAGFEPPTDGPDTEESGIPALYTYFGQFIDHDLVFDPTASFQKQKDLNAAVDFRTPAFDLDNLYGRGPADQPYMYDALGMSFALGDPLSMGTAGARDLVRSPAGRALIGDPRNDENAIISQLQGLFQRFHNRLVREEGCSFEQAQEGLRRAYQHVVLYDFLPRIVNAETLNSLKREGNYDRSKLVLMNPESPFMPIEFSGACFRYGHSMVRPAYRLNDAVLLPVFPAAPPGELEYPEGLTGARRMISNWAIDWGRFIDIERRNNGGTARDKFRRLQFAYRIDTTLVEPLASLPPAIVPNPPPSLALRNLLRGMKLELPTAQTVAALMAQRDLDARLLPDEQIIIGKAVKGSQETSIIEIDKSFARKCPLWAYILAEAQHYSTPVAVTVAENQEETGKVTIDTPRLGPLGGRIVAEVIVGLMFADPWSILNDGPRRGQAPDGGYFLKDFVAFALGLAGPARLP